MKPCGRVRWGPNGRLLRFLQALRHCPTDPELQTLGLVPPHSGGAAAPSLGALHGSHRGFPAALLLTVNLLVPLIFQNESLVPECNIL